MRPITKKTVIVLSLAALLLWAVSCSRSEPQITFGFIALVYYQTNDKPDERFSFFIIPEDDEGVENLEDLYLYHDREQLRWHLQSENWITYVQDGVTWIGSRGIAAGEDESLPRGQYRAVLVNKGGEKTERNFSFDAPDLPRFPFPVLEISGGRYTVDSGYPVNRLLCYDEQGNYISTVNLTSLSGAVSELNLPSQVRGAALWAEDAQYFTSAMTYVTSTR